MVDDVSFLDNPFLIDKGKSGIPNGEVRDVLLRLSPNKARDFLDATETLAIFSLQRPQDYRLQWEQDIKKELKASFDAETKRLGRPMTEEEKQTLREGVVISAVDRAMTEGETEKHKHADTLLSYIRKEGTDNDKKQLALLTDFARRQVIRQMNGRGQWNEKKEESDEFKRAVDAQLHDYMITAAETRQRRALASTGMLEDPPQPTGRIIWPSPADTIENSVRIMRATEDVFKNIGNLNIFNKKDLKNPAGKEKKPDEKPNGKQGRVMDAPVRLASADVDAPAGKPYIGAALPESDPFRQI